jgi:hypothetical protein
MENLIEAIRAALREDAEPTARRAGLAACREILGALEAATEREPALGSDAVPSSEPAEAPPAAAPASGGPEGASNSHKPPTASAIPPPQVPLIDPAAVATLVASFGKLPPEQLLDLAIARLRAALPPGTTVPAPTPLRFQLVPLHRVGGPK